MHGCLRPRENSGRLQCDQATVFGPGALSKLMDTFVRCADQDVHDEIQPLEFTLLFVRIADEYRRSPSLQARPKNVR